jgi:hypothetical protein
MQWIATGGSFKNEKQSNKKFSGLTDIVPKNKKAQKYLHISNESCKGIFGEFEKFIKIN